MPGHGGSRGAFRPLPLAVLAAGPGLPGAFWLFLRAVAGHFLSQPAVCVAAAAACLRDALVVYGAGVLSRPCRAASGGKERTPPAPAHDAVLAGRCRSFTRRRLPGG